MSEWTIYNSAGSVTRCKVKDLEYHGEWMEDEYVSVKVTSPEPVAFALGDYLMYRGEKFEINYDPNVIKKARSGSYGEGFTYDNVKLYSVAAQLKHIGFKDVVLNTLVDNANKLVYSMQGTFQFFAGSVEDLADRIQANLNREFSDWKVMTSNWSRTYQRTNHSVGQATWNNYYNSSSTQGKTDVYMDVENLSCWDALKLSYSAFEVPFYVTSYKVSGTTYHAVIIGGKSIQLGGDLSFEYGKGNGLYEIERTTDESARLVTKLFAYGSEKNLPINYYANIGKRAYATISERDHYHSDYKRSDGTVENTYDAYKLYTTIPWLTVKSSINGDGSNTKVSITKNNVKHTSIATLLPYLAEGTESPQLLCIYLTNGSSSGTVTTDYESDETFYGNVSVNDQVYIDTNVNLNTWPYIYIPQSINYPALLSINRLMLPGFPTQSLFAWVVAHGATNINYQTYRATWHGYTAYFSNDATDPWIKSVNADVIGIREGSVSFDSGDEEIYPTIEGTGFDEVSWAQQIEDNGYLTGEEGSSTFELMPMTVDGDDGGIEWNNKEETVTISMKDGFCVGREFTVQKAERNSVGLWVLTLERKKDDSLERYFPYQESDVQSVHLYQILGRGNYQGQATGDKFVVLGIPLPDAFVQKGAEKLLEKALKELASIDHMRYTYLPKIDEIYMAKEHDEAEEGTSLHDTLHAGMQMEFEDSDLNVHYYPFIDNITIKENGNNGIPTYDVVLRDEKDMTLQEKIQSQIEGGNDAILNIIAGSGGDTKYLSKVNDDTAKGLIRLLKGLQVGEQFLSGLGGQGGVFRTNADGKTYLECDEMYVRMRAYFDTVEIRKFLHSGGNRIASAAGAKCVYVNWLDASGNILEQTNANRSLVKKFRCYFRGEDSNGKVSNDFQVGDQAFCEVTNVESGSLASHRFWRLVVGTSGNDASGAAIVNDNGDYWIDLSNNSSETIGGVAYSGYEAGSDFPQAQDDIVQLGSVNDSTRRGAIIEYVSGNDAPSYQIFQGLGDITGASTLAQKQAKQYTFVGRNYVALGYNSSTGRAFMNVYGDFYFGARPASGQTEGDSFMRYNQQTGELDIKARVIFRNPSSTSSDDDTTLDDFARTMVNDIDNLQSQIDGEIDSWFYNYLPVASLSSTVPLTNVEPYKTWYEADHGGTASETTTERTKHLSDVFYDNSSGYAFRFSKNENTNAFEWVLITDSAVVEALAKAAKAQATADGKMATYSVWGAWIKNGVNTLQVGDLYIPSADYTDTSVTPNKTYKAYKVYKCNTDGTNDFEEIDYTDDSALINFLTGDYALFVQNIQRQVDKKAQTWYQDDNPAQTAPPNGWYGDPDDSDENHVGDIWCDTTSINDGGTHETYIFNKYGSGSSARYAWAAQAVPKEVFDELDGKRAIYIHWGDWDVTNPTTSVTTRKLETKDLYIPQVTEQGGGYTWTANKVYRCTSVGTYGSTNPTFQEINYTDDSKFDGYINAILNGSGSSGDPATVAAAQRAINSALDGVTVPAGGLLLTSLIALRKYKGSGDTSNINNYNTWSGISGVYNDSESGAGFLGHGTAAWYGGDMVDKETLAASVAIETNWPTYRWARSLFRFDGSGYVADGNISWDKTGTLTIKGNVVDTTTLKIGGTTVNLSDYLPKAAGSGEALTGDLYANNIVPNAIEFTTSLPQYYSLGSADRFWQNLFVKRIYLYKPNANNDTGAVYIEYNTTSGSEGVHLVGAGMWTESYLSALGLNNGGGSGVQLAEPLSTINAAGMGAPNTTGQAIVWNGSAWVYSINTTIRAGALSTAGTIAAYGNITSTQGDFIAASGHGFKVSDKDNTYVLLAGGGTVLLSSIGGTYTLDDVADGTTRKLSDYLPLSAGEAKPVTGILFVKNIVKGWNYTNSNNAAAFVFDKNGYNATGIGSHNISDTIWFGACNSAGAWIDNYKQIWQFNGNIKVQNLTLGQDSGGEFTITTVSSDDDIKITANKLTLQGVGDSSGSGGTLLPKGAKFQNVCIECNSDGTYESNRGNEINDFGSPLYLQYNNSKDLYLCTGTNGGNVGIGQQNPTAKLHVAGNAKISNALDAYTITAGDSISSPTYTATGGGYSVSGKDDTYVLLAGGGTSLITSLISSNYVTISTAQTITALKTLTGGLKVSGRAYGGGDDEGIIIGYANNGLAGLILGGHTGRRSVFYLQNIASVPPSWSYNDGTASYKIYHPAKNGTIAVTDDIPSVSSFVSAIVVNDDSPVGATNHVITLSNIVRTTGSTMTGILTVKSPIFGYNYSNSGANKAAFIFDKPGSNYTGIGAHSTSDTIWFGACSDSDGTWLDSYKQIWQFNGQVKAEKFVHYQGTSSQFLKADGSLDSTDYLALVNGVTRLPKGIVLGCDSNTTEHTITVMSGDDDIKIYANKLTLKGEGDTSGSGGTLLPNGAKFYSICIESNSDGTVNTGHSGEINRFGNQDLHLQYDSNTGNITMLRQALTVSLDSYNNVNVVKFSTASNRGIYFYTSGSAPIYGTSGWNNVSDVRMKNIVSYVNEDVERIANAPVFNFTFKNSETRNVLLGTSAQYWMTVLPNAVSVAPNSYLSMDYGATALAAAVLTARKVVDHEKRIRLLEVENEALRKEIDQLKLKNAA